jgi:hypothetical protein
MNSEKKALIAPDTAHKSMLDMPPPPENRRYSCEKSRYHPTRILSAEFTETQRSVRERRSECRASGGFRKF